MTIQTKSLGFNIKAKDEIGTFSAYGNTFDKVDHAGDKTIKGAFAKCIQGWAAKNRMPRLLSQHGHNQNPIGVITSMKEDENGLLFEGKFCTEPGTAGAEAYALVKMGALDSFSIGYNVIEDKIVSGVKELHELDVVEISLVTFACNEDSLIQSVKSAISNNENPVTGVRKALQAAGMTKRQASAAVSAIVATQKIEEKAHTDLELAKTKSETFVANTDKLEVKSSMSMGEYAQSIREAVEKVIGGEDIYMYIEEYYMDYVIAYIYDYSDEENHASRYMRVPYTSTETNDILVGTGEVVERFVAWYNESEIATVNSAFSEGKKDLAPASAETKTEDLVEEDEELSEADIEELKSMFGDAQPSNTKTVEEDPIVDEINIDEINSWFE